MAKADGRQVTATPQRERIERAIEAQRAFMHRVPDPDTRDRAEENLIKLVMMQDELAAARVEGDVA